MDVVVNTGHENGLYDPAVLDGIERLRVFGETYPRPARRRAARHFARRRGEGDPPGAAREPARVLRDSARAAARGPGAAAVREHRRRRPRADHRPAFSQGARHVAHALGRHPSVGRDGRRDGGPAARAARQRLVGRDHGTGRDDVPHDARGHAEHGVELPHVAARGDRADGRADREPARRPGQHAAQPRADPVHARADGRARHAARHVHADGGLHRARARGRRHDPLHPRLPARGRALRRPRGGGAPHAHEHGAREPDRVRGAHHGLLHLPGLVDAEPRGVRPADRLRVPVRAHGRAARHAGAARDRGGRRQARASARSDAKVAS